MNRYNDAYINYGVLRTMLKKFHFYDDDVDLKSKDAANRAIEKVLNIIDNADKIQVNHAHWDEEGNCSHCGTYMEYQANYCPRCGAKMDEKEKENEQIH